jgi:regulator of sirC expression with transglutaminase-like and TPR domain
MTALREDFRALVAQEPIDLVRTALAIARIEFPRLDVDRTLGILRRLGDEAAERLAPLSAAPVRPRIRVLNQLLFEEERFAGNRAFYDDFRNSLLNVVIDRRLGIPLTLALVYMEVGRRAGLEVLGVAFPGHFLVRVPSDAGDDAGRALVLDPFSGGRELDEDACARLLRRHVGPDAPLEARWLEPCTSRDIVVRMLANLKRAYVDARSFPHALAAVDLLLAAAGDLTEFRDRGLLSFHLDRPTAGVRDLEHYLRLRQWSDEDREERDRLREYLDALRRRVAMLN